MILLDILLAPGRFIEWFMATYPVLAYTFDGTMLTLIGLMFVEMLRGQPKEKKQ